MVFWTKVTVTFGRNVEYWHVSTGNPGCLFCMVCLGFGGAYPMNLDDGTSMWGCSKGWGFWENQQALELRFEFRDHLFIQFEQKDVYS